jgi:hypothetical protein
MSLSWNTPEKTFTTLAEFQAAACQPAGDVPASGTAIDFSTSDVVAVTVLGSERPTLKQVGDARWVRRDQSMCVGIAQGFGLAYYVVPKGKSVSVQSCTTTCVCGNGPCQFA